MAKGKYQSKKQPVWIGAAILLVILAILVVLIVVLLQSCNESQPTSDSKINNQKPGITNPVASEPEETEPEATEPEETEPEETEPEETEPEETEPEETEPEETEPEVTEPKETEPEATGPVSSGNGKGEAVAAIALEQNGKPEKSTENPNGFDVGSFITYCFRQCGYSNVPGDFNSLLTYGTEVAEGQNGDVVVFYITPKEGDPYDYIGIVVDGDWFMAVSSSSGMVVKRPISDFSRYPTVYRRFVE